MSDLSYTLRDNDLFQRVAKRILEEAQFDSTLLESINYELTHNNSEQPLKIRLALLTAKYAIQTIEEKWSDIELHGKRSVLADLKQEGLYYGSQVPVSELYLLVDRKLNSLEEEGSDV